MSAEKIPQTDSIRELAEFWDTHDVTDFKVQLEEVTEPIFEPRATLVIHLKPDEAERVRNLAESKGTTSGALVEDWVREKLGAV